ncbi:MAG: hypothetical protein ACLP1X_12910 [Polyangiaceae bacterium]|jgi:hypothetical protein
MPEENRIRTQTLVLRMNREERELLERLSTVMGVSMSDAMRLCVRAEAMRRGIGPTPPRARRSR